MARGDRGQDRRKRRRNRDDDDQRPGRRLGTEAPREAGMRTSATTTAPAAAPDTAASGQDQDDLDAFFSMGHGPAMHYDRSEVEAAESGASG